MKNCLFALLPLCLLIPIASAKDKHPKNKPLSNPKSDVFMQGFYWNSTPGGIWWDSLATLSPQLASAGFSAIWLPPCYKAASGDSSMGYDPYDPYDFGEYNQEGDIATRFGTRPQLINAIQAFHQVGMSVYADAVVLHLNGGEAPQTTECKPSPSYADSQYTKFTYPNGSGRFPKDSSMFYPNAYTCDVNFPYHGPSDPAYQFGLWLDNRQPRIRDSLAVWANYLKQVLGFDGFRIDQAMDIDPAFIGPWMSQVNQNGYTVAEDYDGASNIVSWLNSVIADGGTSNNSSFAAFDFPLRFSLENICNDQSGTQDMNQLDGAGLIAAGASGFNVCTFVENHDLDRIGWNGVDAGGGNPIVYNKMLAYAFVIFSEGRPCVFFKDYYTYGLGRQIDTLIWIRQHYLGGTTTKRSGLNPYYIRDDGNTDQSGSHIYVARRDGDESQPGGYLVINNDASHGWSVWVDVNEPQGTRLRDYTGHNPTTTVLGPSGNGDPSNRVELGAYPRNYSIYVADTTASINLPPVIQPIPSLLVYTNQTLDYKTSAYDEDTDSLRYTVTSGPLWLTVSSSGVLGGTPAYGDTGIRSCILTLSNGSGSTTSDTFSVSVLLNYPPVIQSVRDTTVIATKRFQYQLVASSPSGDTLTYSLLAAPLWLNVGSSTGLLSGIPGVGDTGATHVKLDVSDGRGGADTISFNLSVIQQPDSVVATYAAPPISGSPTNWNVAWRIADSTTQSYWWTNSTTPDNQLYSLYATWDADSLYLGVNYLLNDPNNTLMLYISTGAPNGITNFSAVSGGYKGAEANNIRTGAGIGINFFAAAYDLNAPSFFIASQGDSAINISPKIHAVRGSGGSGAELAVAWNDMFGLGAGLIPPHLQMKMVAVIAGGPTYGGGNSIPNNPSVNGGAGPDTLINFVTVSADTNGDGIPDPTVLDTITHGSGGGTTKTTVSKQVGVQHGWNMVSVPLTMSDYRVTTLFPGASTPAYAYAADTGYVMKDTLKNRVGYFIKFASAVTLPFQGFSRTKDTISVTAGWNLIGSLDSTVSVSNIIQVPSGIVQSEYFYFNAGYVPSTTLVQGKGYWVKVSKSGSLILSE